MPKKKNVEELEQEIDNLSKKIQTLEKFMNDEKKHTDTRVEKLEKSSEQLDNATKALKIDVQAINKSSDEDFKKLDISISKSRDLLDITIEEFNAFKEKLETELEKAAEKDAIMEDLRAKLKEKTVVLTEKEKEIKNLKQQFSESLSKIARLETEVDNLTASLNQSKTLSDEMKKNLELIEKEYIAFKEKEEPIMSQNESIRRLLNISDQGKVYLALVNSYPNSLSIDDLGDILETSTVQIKPILLSMQDIDIIEFNPSTREVKLSK